MFLVVRLVPMSSLRRGVSGGLRLPTIHFLCVQAHTPLFSKNIKTTSNIKTLTTSSQQYVCLPKMDAVDSSLPPPKSTKEETDTQADPSIKPQDEKNENSDTSAEAEKSSAEPSKRFIPEHKKPDAALTFPEKVRKRRGTTDIF